MSLTNGDMKFERPRRCELIDISGVDYGLTTTQSTLFDTSPSGRNIAGGHGFLGVRSTHHVWPVHLQEVRLHSATMLLRYPQLLQCHLARP